MSFLKNKKVLWAISGVLMVFSIYLYQQYHHPQPKQPLNFTQLSEQEEVIPSDKKQSTQSSPTKSPVVMVDVKGGVKHPGVYQFTLGQRVMDAIEKSGGFIEQADQKQINLAEKLEDEMVIYVPIKGEVNANPIISSQGNKDTIVNINSADLNELQSLTGIGPTKAQAIIDYRTKNGPYKTIKDILNVNGISEKSFEKIKDSIKIN